MKKFYITTPLYYVNDEPHIGHAYTTILADVISRYQRLIGHEVFFLTGTDEHGQKVQEAAKKRNVSPQLHVDEYVNHFKNMWKKMNISNNYFIRTTDTKHKALVKDILNLLWSKGDIYIDEYEGLYSVSEERFITQKEAEEGDFRQIKKIKEKNYFFKMSKYQDKLVSYIRNNQNFILPQNRSNEILDIEDTVQIILIYKNFSVQITLCFMHKKQSRNFHIAGTSGDIIWNDSSNELGTFFIL